MYNKDTGSANSLRNTYQDRPHPQDPYTREGPIYDLLDSLATKVQPCPNCHQRVEVLEVREISGAQIFWGFLLLCTMPVICWLPICLRRCDDKRLECRNCKHIYDYFQSSMCPYC